MIWLLLGIIALLLTYIYLIRPHGYWKRQGCPQSNPAFFYGDNWDQIIQRVSFVELIQGFYNKAGKHRYYGIYQGMIPTLLIKDLELLKQLTIKDFDHFQDHRNFIPETADPLWEKNLFARKGQSWKDMRSTLSPSFTSSKMRTIFLLVSECAEHTIKHFLSKDESEIKSIEMKDLCTRFANDVIASVAFGLKVDSFRQRENKFYIMGKKATDFTNTATYIKSFVMVFLPTLARILRLSLFTKDVSNFFRHLVKQTIETREQKNIVRPDMIQLLMEARKNGLKYDDKENTISNDGFATVEESEIGKIAENIKPVLTNDDITAQGLIFFFAGFETISTMMSVTAYELALNPDIQERLIQEIDDTLESCGGKLTYEVLMKMQYLDMVISESLRKWPPAAGTDRVVTKPYLIQPATPDENPLYLKTGDVLMISIIGFHRDPELYPNPDKFDPERFSDENKHNIKPYSYLPFGIGPRNCIGSRFALLEIKTMFVNMLSHFELVVTEKTPIPLKLSKRSFNISAEGGFWLGLKKRNKTQNVNK